MKHNTLGMLSSIALLFALSTENARSHDVDDDYIVEYICKIEGELVDSFKIDAHILHIKDGSTEIFGRLIEPSDESEEIYFKGRLINTKSQSFHKGKEPDSIIHQKIKSRTSEKAFYKDQSIEFKIKTKSKESKTTIAVVTSNADISDDKVSELVVELTIEILTVKKKKPVHHIDLDMIKTGF